MGHPVRVCRLSTHFLHTILPREEYHFALLGVETLNVNFQNLCHIRSIFFFLHILTNFLHVDKFISVTVMVQQSAVACMLMNNRAGVLIINIIQLIDLLHSITSILLNQKISQSQLLRKHHFLTRAWIRKKKKKRHPSLQ